jgi:hypothetical protein
MNRRVKGMMLGRRMVDAMLSLKGRDDVSST